ncbi:hypothetical protein PJL18_03875 [Paenarthrobacter nicotinovorans]|nr:hypothetical protein [Paenarthrobacter nicotinovorans]
MLSVAVHRMIVGPVVSLMAVVLMLCRAGGVAFGEVRFGFADRGMVPGGVMGVLCHGVLLQ